ncbi:MAG: bifunctional phosphoribosylaminoimidazolecarboxamide formyltransferase/IMP cyclohydrolase [Bacteroidales bacterium]|nr:bifunctional phosphoribosylaminoimidazolecarboxamide formyltransferase/IMP cyclohydrolase [Bacteroidales bacterium]
MKALISVSNKTGIVEFAKNLQKSGWEIIATGGTMKLLQDEGVNVINISDITSFPEICDGRVKTLHPNVHGGLLARRDDKNHLQALKENNIEFIDMVCVNLYPFRETIAKPDVTMEDAIENIDIGGPSMLRSGAKNYNDVTVVCDPQDYDRIIEEIQKNGNTTPETRLELSAKAFSHTATYDSCIATYLQNSVDELTRHCESESSKQSMSGLLHSVRNDALKQPKKIFLNYELAQSLRYGENPHQSARFYKQDTAIPYSLAFAKQLHGKELSYNNIQDANAALNIAMEFDEPFCVGLKHANPCGASTGKDAFDAWTKTYEADKVSIFGGIVAFNRTVDEKTALALKPVFLEIVIAPEFTDEALNVLMTKKNLRLLQVDMSKKIEKPQQIVSVNGGILVQDLDTNTVEVTEKMTATTKKPTPSQVNDMNFGWRIVKHVKSNAIVVVKNGCTVGVGAGQMNRIGSAEIALTQAKEKGITTGLVLASDGFFPFDDTVTLAKQYGVEAIVQPGGSVQDEASITKANELGITMLLTGMRHFKH